MSRSSANANAAALATSTGLNPASEIELPRLPPKQLFESGRITYASHDCLRESGAAARGFLPHHRNKTDLSEVLSGADALVENKGWRFVEYQSHGNVRK